MSTCSHQAPHKSGSSKDIQTDRLREHPPSPFRPSNEGTMWLLLELVADGEALELAWGLLELLFDGGSLLDRVSVLSDTPVAFIKPRPWWPPASKTTAQ